MNKFKIAAFYSFNSFSKEAINSLLNKLLLASENKEIKGTVLISEEGVNGTICGLNEGVDYFIRIIRSNLSDNNRLELKFSWSDVQAFRKLKIRYKPEIVTMGVSEINPSKIVGSYINSTEWNKYVSDPETLIIDTRNEYEISIGTFSGSINPHTNSFRDFPDWVDNNLCEIIRKKRYKRIAMFCTGGIRCEKATSYLIKKGYNNIFHLKGGILKYLEVIPENESLWRGECFVFDQRVALNHRLQKGEHELCYACGMPLNDNERLLDDYILGVQCHHCKGKFSDEDRLRFSERQKHYDLLKND